jgi:hypothetical protein
VGITGVREAEVADAEFPEPTLLVPELKMPTFPAPEFPAHHHSETLDPALANDPDFDHNVRVASTKTGRVVLRRDEGIGRRAGRTGKPPFPPGSGVASKLSHQANGGSSCP